MNGDFAIDTKKLAGLGAERLARILASAGERLSSVRFIVEVALIMETDPAEAANLINGELVRLKRADRYVDWRQLSAFASELDLLLDAIVEHLADVDPARAFECLCNFMDIAAEIIEHSDDDGYLADSFAHAGTFASEILKRISNSNDRAAAIARGEVTCRGDRIGVTDELAKALASARNGNR